MSDPLGGLRQEIRRRYRATVEAAGGPALELPPAIRETLAGLPDLLGACPEALLSYYTERAPRQRLGQLAAPPDIRALLTSPLDLAALPRLREALEGLYRALAGAGLDAGAFLGAASPAQLLAARATVEQLYAPTLFGAGVPLLGLSDADQTLFREELGRGASPAALVDLRLSGNLMHELCHGLSRERERPPPPWMVIEAAALHLGCAARPAHVFPDDPGEAVPGVSLFVQVGSGLARLFGAGGLWRALTADTLDEVLPERAAWALQVAGWQDLAMRREPPLVRDALRAEGWVKLADACRAEGGPLSSLDRRAKPTDLPDLVGLAEQLPWCGLPWYADEPTAADEDLVPEAVTALFQLNCLRPTYQTQPDDPPGGRLWLDVAGCTLGCAARPEGIFGEPARWIFPPPLGRRLAERGARRVHIEGATRPLRGAIAAALIELCRGRAPLPEEPVLRWTSSPG